MKRNNPFSLNKSCLPIIYPKTIRNAIDNNHLVDYLKFCGKNKKAKYNSFKDDIMKEGLRFEEELINLIEKKHKVTRI